VRSGRVHDSPPNPDRDSDRDHDHDRDHDRDPDHERDRERDPDRDSDRDHDRDRDRDRDRDASYPARKIEAFTVCLLSRESASAPSLPATKIREQTSLEEPHFPTP
jgi:hypothetical protein